MKLFHSDFTTLYAIDNDGIFPIIINQRGVFKLIAGTMSHIIEAPHTFELKINCARLHMESMLPGIVRGRIIDVWEFVLSPKRLETTFL